MYPLELRIYSIKQDGCDVENLRSMFPQSSDVLEFSHLTRVVQSELNGTKLPNTM
jgi:hypothetical protein